MTTQLATHLQDALGSDYRLEHELEGGGMSRLFLATDVRHNRPVVVKVLSPELVSELSTARFKREIELTVRLQHPHILPILTSGAYDDVLYYITPFIAGESLRTRIAREGKLPLDDILRILRDASGALAFAHARGIVHRDVKPGNILLADGHAILADFGIARATATNATPLTGSGMSPGTPAYMAPELPTDESADVYALGVVAYEMLCGALPPRGATAKDIIAARGRVKDDAQDSVSAIASTVAGTIGGFAQARPASAREFHLRLDTQRGRPGRWLVGMGAALLIAIAGAAYATMRDDREPLSTARFAVIAQVSSDAVTGDIVRQVSDRLSEWRGVQVVDSAAIADATQHVGPKPTNTMLHIARSVGAGSLIVVDAGHSTDSVTIRATLYDVAAQKPVRYQRIAYDRIAPDSLRVTVFRQLVNRFLRDSDQLPWMNPRDRTSASLIAWRAFDSGREALRRWDLSRAEALFREAIVADPILPPAHVWLAQTLAWSDTARRNEQRVEALRALQWRSRLDTHDSLLALGLSSLAKGDFADNCVAFRSLIAEDSSDATAWLGFGDCQARDPEIIANRRTISGWAFRSSFESAARAYGRASEQIDPKTGSAFRGWLLGRLSTVLYSATNRVRLGFVAGLDTARFGAFPFLNHDTLAFAPHPLGEFATRRGDPAPALVQAAVFRNREILRATAEEWVAQSPRDASAIDSLAAWSEVADGFAVVEGRRVSTLELLDRARALSSDSTQQLRLAISQARVLLKESRFVAAHDKADSLLGAGAEMRNRDVAGLPGLTALLGRVNETRRLLPLAQGTYGILLPSGRVWTPPAAIANASAALLVYATMGASADSVPIIAARTWDLITSFVPDTIHRAEIGSVLVTEPLSYASPNLMRFADSGLTASDEVARTALSVARGDTADARRRLVRFGSMQKGQLPGNGLPGAYRLAVIALELGDTVDATRRLDEILRTLPVVDPSIMSYVTHVGSLVRAIALRAQLAQRAGNSAIAKQNADAVVALWRNADNDLQLLVSDMRAIQANSR